MLQAFIDIEGRRLKWDAFFRNELHRRGDWIQCCGKSFLVSRVVWSMDRTDVTVLTHLATDGEVYRPPAVNIVAGEDGETYAIEG